MSTKLRGPKLFFAVLPLSAFVITFIVHFVWFAAFPEQSELQSKWIMMPNELSPVRQYLDSKSYWLGYTYGICFAFIIAAGGHYLKNRSVLSRNFAVGGVSLTGLWAFAACFLIGCCGSPMLVVWMNLFGAKFVPLAKPLLAIITTVSLAVSWVWMKRRMASRACGCEKNMHEIQSDCNSA